MKFGVAIISTLLVKGREAITLMAAPVETSILVGLQCMVLEIDMFKNKTDLYDFVCVTPMNLILSFVH